MPKRPESPEYWPTEGWRISTPEAQGMDSLLLADMLAEIEVHRYAVDSVSVVRHGYLVLDAYVHPFGPNQQHEIYSCTKSVVSALVGIAIAEGHIKGVEQPLFDFFPERAVGPRRPDFFSGRILPGGIEPQEPYVKMVSQPIHIPHAKR